MTTYIKAAAISLSMLFSGVSYAGLTNIETHFCSKGDGYPTTQSFNSEQEAVVAATSRFIKVSRNNDQEFIGAIYKSAENQYHYSWNAGIPGQDQVELRAKMFKHLELVAFWHTHGDHGELREWFSETDHKVVAQMGKPFYLATPDQLLRVLKPGDRLKRARISNSRFKPKMAKGHPVHFNNQPMTINALDDHLANNCNL